MKKGIKGITLISLIITIVIMLILAAVALSLVIGNNGLFKKATSAALISEMASVKEEIQTDLAAEQISEDASITSDQIEEVFKKYGTVNYEENSNIKSVTTTKGYEILLSDVYNGEIKTSGINANAVSKAPVEYYGKYVKNYTCPNSAGVNSWQIFYADSDNIYLIADNYITKTYAPRSANYALKGSENSMLFGDVVKDYQGAQNITNPEITKWLSYLNGHETNNTLSMKSVAFMLDTNVWKVFKGDKAKYAVGAPTLDLLAASYNQTHPDNKLLYRVRNDDCKYGYEFKFENDVNYTYDSLRNLDPYHNLYMKSNKNFQDMWLATPSSYNYFYVLDTYYDCNLSGTQKYGVGFEHYDCDYENDISFRPIVCLNHNVGLEQLEDGNFNIK